MNIIDCIDSIFVQNKETADKKLTKAPMGAAAKRAPLYVCGVNVGDLFLWHMIYGMYNIERICRFDRTYRI